MARSAVARKNKEEKKTKKTHAVAELEVQGNTQNHCIVPRTLAQFAGGPEDDARDLEMRMSRGACSDDTWSSCRCRLPIFTPGAA